MDGITVLNEIVNTIPPASMLDWIFILGLTILLTIFCIIAWVTVIRGEDWKAIVPLLLYSAVVIVMWSFTCSIYKNTQREPYTTIQYEVTISDEVSFTEFNKKYEIIEQRGDIYVIQEREKANEQN